MIHVSFESFGEILDPVTLHTFYSYCNDGMYTQNVCVSNQVHLCYHIDDEDKRYLVRATVCNNGCKPETRRVHLATLVESISNKYSHEGGVRIEAEVKEILNDSPELVGTRYAAGTILPVDEWCAVCTGTHHIYADEHYLCDDLEHVHFHSKPCDGEACVEHRRTITKNANEVLAWAKSLLE